MSEQSTFSRRAVLAAGGTAALSTALGSVSEKAGNLFGGTMALEEAYNVAGELWIGPDSAKADVDANSGRVFVASDTQVEYYGDGGSWNKMGVGSSQEPVPSLHTDEESITADTLRVYKPGVETYDDYRIDNYADIGDAITQAAADQVDAHEYGKTGGKIRLPTTQALTLTTADLSDGSVLAGAGIRSSAIEADAGMTDPLVRHAPATGDKEFFECVRDLRIDANSEDCVGYKHDDSGGNPTDHHVKEVIIRDTGQEAMDISGGWGLRVDNVLVEGCGINSTHTILTKGMEQHWRGCFVAYNEGTYAHTTWGAPNADILSNKSYVDHSVYENTQNGVLARDAGQEFVKPTISGNGISSPGSYDGMKLGLSGNRDAVDTTITGGIFNGYSKKASQQVTDVGLQMFSDDCVVQGTKFKNHISEDIIVDASNCVLEGIHCYGDVLLTSNSSNCRVTGRVKGTLTDNGTSNDVAGVV